MMVMLKKLQQKYARVKSEMLQWDKLQSQLLSDFENASSIVNRLQMLNEDVNYDVLIIIPGIKDRLLGKQMEALQMIFISMKDMMKEFNRIVMALDKIARDADQLLRGLTPYQMQLHVGIQPSLQQCIGGLKTIHEMHKSEFLLKADIISTFTTKYLKCSVDDLAALRKPLVDEPNIPKDEVQKKINTIFPEDT